MTIMTQNKHIGFRIDFRELIQIFISHRYLLSEYKGVNTFTDNSINIHGNTNADCTLSSTVNEF